jgi:hypothetical protein
MAGIVSPSSQENPRVITTNPKKLPPFSALAQYSLNNIFKEPKQVIKYRKGGIKIKKRKICRSGNKRKINKEKNTRNLSVRIFVSKRIEKALINVMDWAFKGIFPAC